MQAKYRTRSKNGNDVSNQANLLWPLKMQMARLVSTSNRRITTTGFRLAEWEGEKGNKPKLILSSVVLLIFLGGHISIHLLLPISSKSGREEDEPHLPPHTLHLLLVVSSSNDPSRPRVFNTPGKTATSQVHLVVNQAAINVQSRAMVLLEAPECGEARWIRGFQLISEHLLPPTDTRERGWWIQWRRQIDCLNLFVSVRRASCILHFLPRNASEDKAHIIIDLDWLSKVLWGLFSLLKVLSCQFFYGSPVHFKSF